ncbi:LuxR C-terminal-related transcriptional regulator [Actinoplanes aureus]|uniref:Winged helix-turn-helix transcriptional regulator n=1 Tax=Actinoplanes aureus TaxID=2792083 RepID=A0A931C9W7_9ACTN|nr:LuxR C-terminal-related transcriptional regulator [Actinoplanes aureus]MBG0564844.1 winged helix-turn-helix transcriptional regulator [Actinoplanes aureus]
MLEPIGLDAAEEDVYRQLISRRSARVEDLAEATGRSVIEVGAVMAALVERGLATGGDSDYVPAPPTVSLGALLRRRQADLREAELAVVALAEEYRTAGQPADVIEIITDVHAVRRRFFQIQEAAREEVRSMVVPDLRVVPHRQNTAERAALRRGVRYRALLDRRALSGPEMAADVRASLAAGQQIRIADTVPVKMMIVDSETALLPLHGDDSAASVLIHRSGLLSVLISFFEAEWKRAYPLRAGAGPAGLVETQPGDLDDLDREVLTLLLAGLTDQAIAGQLGLSARTLHRRIRQLMGKAGVDTRVQLGWVAARKQWA